MTLAYSTCQRCGDILQVLVHGQLTHPTCEPVDDERLVREFCDAVQREDEPEIVRLEKLLNAPKPEPKLGPSALWYAKAGWYVLPLRPGTKLPATRNGLHDASDDPDVVKRWWGASGDPNYNVGIRTGTHFDCVDIDGPTGMKSAAGEKFPDVHGRVLTPNGVHLYILPTHTGNKVGVLPGIDVRSDSGYVVAPPSVIGGRRYTWAIKPSPEILGKAS